MLVIPVDISFLFAVFSECRFSVPAPESHRSVVLLAPIGGSWQNHIPFGRSFSFQFAPQLVGSEKAHLLTPSIINWELFCRLHERIFVNFLWTVATTTKRASTQHIKSAGENLSPYLWWNYVPALLFRNLQCLLFPLRWQTQQQERYSRNLFRRLPCVSFQIFSCGLCYESKI